MPTIRRCVVGLLVIWLIGAQSLLKAADEKALWQPYYVYPRSGAEHISLTGDWQLGYRNAPVEDIHDLDQRQKWIRAVVPSTVQTALHRSGELPDPYLHLNSQKYSWVDEKVWYYRKAVTIPGSARGKYVFLCFDGIDYYARVWLNGVLLGRHEGMFGGPVIEVSGQVRYGSENRIVVEVKAGDWGVKGSYNPRAPGKVIKPWVIAGGTGAEMFFPLGMWQSARIEIVPRTHIERPFLVTEAATPNKARLKLSLEVLAGVQAQELPFHPWKNEILRSYRDAWTSTRVAPPLSLKMELLEKGASVPAFSRTFPITAYEGRNWIEQPLTVPNPKLWWPNGMGEPHLYRVRLTLLRQGAPIDAIEFDYGIRTIETRPTAGPRTLDRWANWQFVVNGRPLFVKGVNWMPADILLDLPRERYEWLLSEARAAGVQLVRVWGGGILETEAFYSVANELGIMVWQDFPIGNMDTPDWPQDVWESQVMQTIYRLRNHPALALYCGGNEFNAYSQGNAATIGIFERSLAGFDPTRPFRRTSPDEGSIHTYPDMDPAWYSRLYKLVPYISETGMHNMPEAQAIREVVDPKELEKPLSDMYSDEFSKLFPELRHHFVEFSPNRVPRMLSRASHIIDISAPTLDGLAEATQIGAGEFYQVLSESVQANYPVTAGLMPWVFKRPWPVIAIQLVDGFGQPTAPYYFLKRTYQPTHVAVRLPYLLWSPGEKIPVELTVTHAGENPLAGLIGSVEVTDDRFQPLWRRQAPVALKAGPSVTEMALGDFTIPQEYRDRFLFFIAELKDSRGRLISRSVYWPRSLKLLEDESVRAKFRQSPVEWPTLNHGPWLKDTVAASKTSLQAELLSIRNETADRARIVLRVHNAGGLPAFLTRFDIQGAKRAFFASENFFWLGPGERREVTIEVKWRDPSGGRNAAVTASAWNAGTVTIPLSRR